MAATTVGLIGVMTAVAAWTVGGVAAAGLAVLTTAWVAHLMLRTMWQLAFVPITWGVAAGLWVTAQVSAYPTSKSSTLVVIAGITALLLHRVLARAPERAAAQLNKWADVLLGACILARLASLVGGGDAFATGSVLSVQVGEFTRVAAGVLLCSAVSHRWTSTAEVLATARRPGMWHHRTAFRSILLGVAYLGVLALARDLGPSVLVVLGCVAALPVWRSLTARRLWFSAGLVMLLVLLVVPFTKGAARLGILWSSAGNGQMTAAWEAMHFGGLVGTGSSPILHAVPAVASDLMPAAVIACFGGVPAAVLAALLVVTVVKIVIAADSVQGPSRAPAVAAATMLAALTVWTWGANVGALPLSGLSSPFVAVTGSSIIPAMATLAIARGFTQRPQPSTPVLPSTVGIELHRVLPALAVTVLLLVSSASWMAPSGLSNSTAEAMDGRGDVLTIDGAVVASTDPDGHRLRPSEPGLYQQINYSARMTSTNGYTVWTGIDRNEARELVCGATTTGTEQFDQIFRPPACRGVDVVATVDSRVQGAAAKALSGLDGQLAILETNTGNVVALYDSTDSGPDVIGDDFAAETRYNSSRPTRPGFPASTMKVVTAAAGLLDGTDLTNVPLTVFPTPDGGVRNMDGFTCPNNTIRSMLAYSCNTTASAIAVAAGQSTLENVAREYFGFGTPTNHGDGSNSIDAGYYTPATLGLESHATVGDLARTGFGMQNVRANVLNLAAVGAVVNEAGRLAPSPRLIAGTCDAGAFSERPVSTSTIGQRPLPEDVSAAIIGGMSDAVDHGTATALGSSGVGVAAKTGTADIDTLDGTVEDTTVVAIVDGRYSLALRVNDSHEDTSAVKVAAEILPALSSLPDTRDEDPTCPR